MKHGRYKIHQGDALTILKILPSKSVHMVCTSPPYWNLRSYLEADDPLKPLELGSEKTPEEYVVRLVEVFREVKRVLRDDGCVFINLGDSYVTQPAGNFGKNMSVPADGGRYRENKPKMDWKQTGLKPKDLCGIPWRVALALQADGWTLRSDIIWSKPNPMPESCTDRPTKAHEYLFLLTKKPRYFYDAEAIKEQSIDPESHQGFGKRNMQQINKVDPQHAQTRGFYNIPEGKTYSTRNRRTVWTIATQAYPEAHFATFPTALVEPCILAGTSERGCCLECKKPWVRVVERTQLKRHRPDDRTMRHEAGGGINSCGNTVAGVESTTLGWRPDCMCYGLQLIADQVPKPSQKKDEPESEWKERLVEWEKLLVEWYKQWDRLKPQYDVQLVVPAVVCDPFMGSGTTLQVAVWKGRNAIGIELNLEYIELARRRIRQPLEGTKKPVYNKGMVGFDFGDVDTIKELA